MGYWWHSSVGFGHVEAMCGGAQVYDSASLMTFCRRVVSSLLCSDSVSSVGCVAEVVTYVRSGGSGDWLSVRLQQVAGLEATAHCV